MSTMSHAILRAVTCALLLFQLSCVATSEECVSAKQVKDTLDTYSVRAIALGVPQAALSCVHRTVHSAAVAAGTDCFHTERFGEVMGGALPECIKSSSPELPFVSRIESSLPTAVRRRAAKKGCRPWCHCYCDSGCHYCCSFRGSGIPGRPWQSCFRNLRCPIGLSRCNR